MFKISSSTPSDGQGQVPADLPIHTMKKDLEEVSNPPAVKTNGQDTFPQENYVLNEAQKSSPFLSTASQLEKIPASIKFKDEISEQRLNEDKIARQKTEENSERERRLAEEKKIAEQKSTATPVFKSSSPAIKIMPQIKPTQERLTTSKNFFGENNASSITVRNSLNFKKLLTVALSAIIVVLIIASGVYYFLVIRQREAPVVIVPKTPTPPDIPETPLKNAKYLIIEQPDATTGEIKTVLKTYADEFLASGETTPAEYIVVDAKNNPILFSAFANSLGLTLSPTIMSNLEDTFSLFIYNDQNAARLGLAIDSKDDTLLKAAMLKEGKNILSETLPLFMDAPFATPTATAYIKCVYNDTELYYINLLPSAVLASNYGVLNEKLIIGTSKYSIFAIVDYIKSSGAITDTEE